MPGSIQTPLVTLAAIGLVAGWLAPHHGDSPRSLDEPVALVGATVIDGLGGPPVPNQTVVLSKGKVAGVFPAAQAHRIPPGAIRRDVSGKFLIPGLIDGHVHLATDPTGRDASARELLAAALAGGITTVRDMAGDGVVLAQFAKECADASKNCPRVHFAALFAGATFFTDPRARASSHGDTPGTTAWQRAVNDSSDVHAFVEGARASGATGIKLYADLTTRQVEAIVAEARSAKIPVWAHASLYPTRPSDLVRAGATSLSHAPLLVWDATADTPERYHDRRPRAPYATVLATDTAMARLLTSMQKAGTLLDATLWVCKQLEDAPAGAGGFAEPRRMAEWAYAVTRRAHELGVLVSAGTDGMMARSGQGLPNIHEEMELLVVKAGFTPLAAIQAATSTNAMALGRSGDLGRIAEGYAADLVVLNANPAIDIRNTRQIQQVYKGGVPYLSP